MVSYFTQTVLFQDIQLLMSPAAKPRHSLDHGSFFD